MFGRQLRVPVVSRFQQGDDVLHQPTDDANPRRVVYLMTKGRNTSWLLDNKQLRLASNSQISSPGSDTGGTELPAASKQLPDAADESQGPSGGTSLDVEATGGRRKQTESALGGGGGPTGAQLPASSSS